MQDQHRLRHPPRHDRQHPQVHGRTSRSLRSARLPQARPRSRSRTWCSARSATCSAAPTKSDSPAAPPGSQFRRRSLPPRQTVFRGLPVFFSGSDSGVAPLTQTKGRGPSGAPFLPSPPKKNAKPRNAPRRPAPPHVLFPALPRNARQALPPHFSTRRRSPGASQHRPCIKAALFRAQAPAPCPPFRFALLFLQQSRPDTDSRPRSFPRRSVRSAPSLRVLSIKPADNQPLKINIFLFFSCSPIFWNRRSEKLTARSKRISPPSSAQKSRIAKGERMKPIYKEKYPHLFEPLYVGRTKCASTTASTSRPSAPAPRAAAKTATAASTPSASITGCATFRADSPA